MSSPSLGFQTLETLIIRVRSIFVRESFGKTVLEAPESADTNHEKEQAEEWSIDGLYQAISLGL